ncbi:uncharacterized protein LOC129940535 isoform X2 [Eupeodes corollae]|uniref:uncharacterized protein LOC129940535 isoform X2 n=1 Tax=Eupeodes corollae TaxID=290404 RepID=UPI002491694B|nr:uncharacterized protein LOC129940535 isoform X2 [Eupeodes corollae]
MEEVISISDSDEEAAPLPSSSSLSSRSTASSKNPSTQKGSKGSITPTYSSTSTASLSSGSITPSPLLNIDLSSQLGFESTSRMALYKPLGADLLAARQLEALKKKKKSIMHPFPAVRDVVTKMRTVLGTNDLQLSVLGLAQQYITALKIYQANIINCPNRCRLLARHMIRTMCLIRDLSRHFFDSPHYSQKMCELLAIYIHFELQCAGDFKDSKIKIAERIIHNIHLHLENAQSSFVLRIFSFLANMGKENEIATKVFRRLIPEPTIMIKNELPDRLFIQYLIAFYHWKETWNDLADQQKVVAFANKFMKPMSTIKTNKMYAQHLPCYIKRDDATAYFLTNMVFFNDLRNASILDGSEETGPALVDLSEEDDKEYPILDLSEYTMEPLIKTEPGGVVDLTSDANEPWMNRLIRRAVALEVILPAILATRNEDQAPAVVEINDSDSENANSNDNNAENENEEENENENGKENEDDDSWAFGLRNEHQQEGVEHLNLPVDEESNSMDEIYNEMNSSIDFVDDSTTESEIERKKGQKERFEIASKLTDAQARITFDGIVEKELKAKYFQTPTTCNAAVTTTNDTPSTSKAVATTSKAAASDKPTSSIPTVALKTIDQPTISKIASVGENPTSSKAAVAIEKTASMETVEVPTKKPTSIKAAVAVEKSNSAIADAADGVNTGNTIEEEELFTLEAIQEVETTPISNETVLKTTTESAALIFGQEEQTSIVDQTLTQTTNNQASDTVLKETQAPKEAITFNMDETLLSSFDSSDESDEDFLGRFQQPPFKTYLRRAHRRPTKKSTKLNNTSSSEEDANVEKQSNAENISSNRPSSPTLPSNEGSNESANILFSGKVISLREEECSGGVTPNYLNVPESIEISKNGSNVVFSMQGRRLSSFPSLKVTNEQGVPDFDADICMTGEEDSNSRTEEIPHTNKTLKKSNISSNMKNQNSLHGTDKHAAKVKSVWFAESPQVREIEARSTPSSQQKPSAINLISSTINKISANKQHFSSKVFSSQSTKTTSTINKSVSTTITKPTINLSESNKTLKPNHLIKSRIPTTESSPATAALKSAQEKDLLQILFPEVFAPPPKPDRKVSEPKPAPLIKATITSGYNFKSSNNKNNFNTIINRRESVTSVSAPNTIDNTRRKSMSTGSDRQSHSDFDKYLERKKLLKPPKSTSTAKTMKTEKAKTKRPRMSKKTKAIIANDPKLGSQMKPIVVLNHVAGPVFILRSGISSETFTEVSPGVFKLNKPPPSMPMPIAPVMSTAKKIPAIRTKSLSDILSDVVVQEMTGKGIETPQDGRIPISILADSADVGKQPKQRNPCQMPPPIANTVPESLPHQEKEKEEEDKIEERVQTEVVPLINTAVKSQDELELKQIKKEEMESKSPPPEVTANVIPSKPVLDCFKKPLKSMAQKRLASASFIHGTAKYVQGPKSASIIQVRQEVAAPFETVTHRQEIQEPVTSTNSHLFLPLTSESESDSSCRTEQTGDVESSEQSDSSQTLVSPRRNLKVRLRRHAPAQTQLEYSIVSNCLTDEMKSKVADGERKRRGRNSSEKKSEALNRIFERADSSTSSSPPNNLDQQPPQSGLINGVLVPSIEAMNTPPPTPPTTVDDKSSVADDTSQEAKSQTTPEPSNIDQSPPLAVFENGANMQNAENNIDVVSSNIPPTNNHKSDENLQVHANDVYSFKASPRQRRRFESLNLPSSNQKRSRKKSTAETSDDISSNSTYRSQVKKRRKTICTDVFNPPDISSDEEICPDDQGANSPALGVKQMYMFARGLKLSKTLSRTMKQNRQEPSITDPSSVRLNDDLFSSPPHNVCDSSRLSPTFAALDPSSTTSTPIIATESENMQIEGSSCSNRPSCDSPVTTSRNLARSKCSLKNPLKWLPKSQNHQIGLQMHRNMSPSTAGPIVQTKRKNRDESSQQVTKKRKEKQKKMKKIPGTRTIKQNPGKV